MIRLFIVFLSLAVWPPYLFAQDYAADRIPFALKSRASAIIRHENIEIDMKNDAHITESVTRTITVLNKSGEKYGDIDIYYNKGRAIRKITGTVYDEFGKPVKKFGTKDFSDYSAGSQSSMYDDVRVKQYTPNMHNYPYTIEYTYEIKHSQSLYIPYWRPNAEIDLAVENSTYQFSCKTDQELRIKEENIPNPVRVEQLEKAKVYTWKASDLPARKYEPYSPSQLPDEICVKIVPRQFYYFKKTGQIDNWKDLGKWVYDELLKDKKDLPEATKNKVKEIASQYTTDKEKARALYAYMQQKTRYISIQVGIGGIEPFSASYVDRLGYGDCKALVNYMQSLLGVVNIPSYYCIVEAGNTKINMDKDFANIVDGNHIILCLPQSNDTTWLECTNNKIPFGFLGKFTDDRQVLACTPDGGKILHTPKYDAQDNLQSRHGKFDIDPSGSVSGKLTTVFSGTQFDNRFPHTSLPPTELNKALKQAYNIDNILFEKVKYDLDEQGPTPKITEDIDVHIKNYVVKNGNNIIIQPNIFNHEDNIPESRKRTNKVYINRGYTDTDKFEFTLAKPIQGEVTPVLKTLSCPMAEFELKIVPIDDKINFSRTITVHEGTYPADDYDKFYDFLREVSSLDRGKFNIPLVSN